MKQLTANELKAAMFPDLIKALKTFSGIYGVSECVIVQKCNCVEVYTVINNTNINDKVIEDIKEKWLTLTAANNNPDILDKAKIQYGKEAIRHLYRVASSLESLIVGDNPVLSQVTDAFNMAVNQGVVGDVLSHMFKESFKVAKDIYKQTKLHSHGISLGRAATGLLFAKFSEPLQIVAVIGTGHIGEVVVNSIHKKWKSTKISVITHRPEYVETKYKDQLIQGFNYSKLTEIVSQSDALILCTDIKIPVISANLFRQIVEKGKLKIAIDMGMPPNMEPVEKVAIPMYSLVDVKNFGLTEFHQRLEEAKLAEDIVNQAYNTFDDTIVYYEKNRLLKKLEPMIQRAINEPDSLNSVMGVLIKLLDKLNAQELNILELAIEKSHQINNEKIN